MKGSEGSSRSIRTVAEFKCETVIVLVCLSVTCLFGCHASLRSDYFSILAAVDQHVRRTPEARACQEPHIVCAVVLPGCNLISISFGPWIRLASMNHADSPSFNGSVPSCLQQLSKTEQFTAMPEPCVLLARQWAESHSFFASIRSHNNFTRHTASRQIFGHLVDEVDRELSEGETSLDNEGGRVAFQEHVLYFCSLVRHDSSTKRSQELCSKTKKCRNQQHHRCIDLFWCTCRRTSRALKAELQLTGSLSRLPAKSSRIPQV